MHIKVYLNYLKGKFEWTYYNRVQHQDLFMTISIIYDLANQLKSYDIIK